MNCSIEQCALLTKAECHNPIKRVRVQGKVGSLQARIVKVVNATKLGKIKRRQWRLIDTFVAQMLAVKQVTGSGGDKTPSEMATNLGWFIPTAMESYFLCDRVSYCVIGEQWRYKRLEQCAVKVACPVPKY